MRANASIARRLIWRLLLVFALAPGIAVVVLMLAGSGKPNLRIDAKHERQADAAVALLSGSEDRASPHPILVGARFLVYRDDPAAAITTWPNGLKVSNWELRVGYQTVRWLPSGYARFLFLPSRDDWHDLLFWLSAELIDEDLPLLALLLVVLAPLAFLSVRGSLQPVRQLAREAAMIEPGRGDTRLSERQSPAELLPLVKAINGSLDRIDAGFAAQRRFAARVAHELRTPLAVIAARLEQPPTPERVGEIRDDLRGMAHLIDQLLTISEISARRLRVDVEVDLAALARDLVGKRAPAALRGGKSIELAAPDRPIVVRGNTAAITTALRNLVDNALRHSPPGGLVLVRVAERPPAIEVADHGPGVAPEERDRIFEPFWRGGGRSGAAGLGLAIVKEMAELHGADVSVHDNQPHGAVFRIVFRPLPGAGNPVERGAPRVKTLLPA